MPTGILGQAALTTNVSTDVYTVPSSTVATCNINICNRGSPIAYIRVALASSTSPTNAEFIEFDTELLTGQVLERGGIVLNAGKKVVVLADTPNVSVTVYGYEE